MAKTKVSEWSATPANNTDVGGIDINEGCAPSGINNAIRDVMAQIKDMQTGADGDNFVVGGNLTVSSTLTANSSVGTAGQALLSRGAGLSPEWGAAFVSGMIMMWSGSIASIPSGWLLCNGSNGTPDLRNRFVVGAGSTYSVGGTGGSANATLVSHTHTVGTTSLTGQIRVISESFTASGSASGVFSKFGPVTAQNTPINVDSGDASGVNFDATHSHTLSTEGSSATNANLPPYYALAYIMKA
jgi:microcystin-dependent protein